MLSGPIGAWVGALTVPPVSTVAVTALESMHLYGHVFLNIGLATGFVAVLMWLGRPFLNRLLIAE